MFRVKLETVRYPKEEAVIGEAGIRQRHAGDIAGSAIVDRLGIAEMAPIHQHPAGRDTRAVEPLPRRAQ